VRFGKWRSGLAGLDRHARITSLFVALSKKRRGSNLKEAQDQSAEDDRLAATYSSTEVGEQQIGFIRLSVACKGTPVCSLDKSIGNQAIESRLCFSCRALSRHDIAKDSQLLDGNGEGFYHLTAPH
jgi:hypothetical protein